MAKERTIFNSKFYGGMTRDDKSKIAGTCKNIEEVDIFSNADFIQAEQIMTTDTMPADTAIYSYTSGDDDAVYGYGIKTGASGEVRIVKVTTGGATDPGSFATAFTSSDATNAGVGWSPIQWFETSEAKALYYVKGASSTWYLMRYNLGNTTEERYTGSAWSGSGALDSNTQLDKITGSYSRVSMKVIFGDLYITNGKYIAKVDKDGVFTQHAFTMPSGWDAVDIAAVSDVSIILARSSDYLLNVSKGFWWDLTATTQFDDSFDIPAGGPQWIVNHKETIKFCCAINGTARFFQMSGAFPGAVPIELPGLVLSNVATETSTVPISHPKMVSVKDKILYFALWKTDKTGIYAIGQLDSDKPWAMILSKRFASTDYANHQPRGMLIVGPNYYGAYTDQGTSASSRCESANSPTRSSNAVYESLIIDGGDPTLDKNLFEAFVTTYPLGTSTDVNVSIASNYGSLAEVFRADATSFNTAGGVLGVFKPKSHSKKKVFQVKIAFVSNGSTSPKVTGYGLRWQEGDVNAAK